jgi:SNF2 family DNA or RNA helicase
MLQEYPVLVMSGDDSQRDRKDTLELALELHEEELPFWLVINPAFSRYTDDKTAEKVLKKGKWVYPRIPVTPELEQIHWQTLIVDEFHLAGLGNTGTGFYEAIYNLRVPSEKHNRKGSTHVQLLSGTPVSGKPVKLFGPLSVLEPQKYTSKWTWVEEWLVTEDNGYGKIVSNVQSGREDDFWLALQPHMVRRTKAEVAKDLPPKNFIEIWAEMTPKQEKQYKTFAANAEIKIEEENLSATSILAEYTRLKQFADARQTVESWVVKEWDDEKGREVAKTKFKVTPTTDSGKLPHVLEVLQELGVKGAVPAGEETTEQVIIASQFSQITDMVHKWLLDQNIPSEKITGGVNRKGQRDDIVNKFQAGEVGVVCLSTKAGGVALTLDNANTVIVLDETWVPDDQDQVVDRAHRISRMHQVNVYVIRSKGTIEEYIENVVIDKDHVNKDILDLRRQGLKAVA